MSEDFNQFEEDLRSPQTDLWLRHLAADGRMLTDFQKYLNVMIARAAALGMDLRGPERYNEFLMLQGGCRALASIRLFVSNFLKQSSEKQTERNGNKTSHAG